MVWERDAILATLTKKGFELGNDGDNLVLTFAGLTRTKLARNAVQVYGDVLLGEVRRQLQLTRKQLDSLVRYPVGRMSTSRC